MGAVSNCTSNSEVPKLKKRVAVLGATGSIGKSTIEVLRAYPQRFEPVLFSANSNSGALAALAKEFPNAMLALSGYESSDLSAEQARADIKKSGLDGLEGQKFFFGQEGLFEAIKRCCADIAVNGIAGAAGLRPSIAVLECGCDLALANKETVVMAWELVAAKAAERGAKIIPVDSEHSAIFTLINAHCNNNSALLSEIILTASGGPFRNFSKDALEKVKVCDALAHPTWKMGKKITVDSASLANKGLEVIEAVRLFNVPSNKVKVVIHPQSIVHSLIRLIDGSIYAEMSKPDMRFPIQKALFYPERPECAPSTFGKINFDRGFEPINLNFEPPDLERFPMLALAYKIADSRGGETIAYNAANEITVDAFLSGKAGFAEIPRICEKVLEKDWTYCPKTIEEVLETDRRARELGVGSRLRPESPQLPEN